MKLLNFNSWQEFSFDDIFEIRSGFFSKKPEHTSKGNIRFLGASDKNNGVTEYYSLEDIKNTPKSANATNSPLSEKLFPPNALCVTNNGSVGFAYYQDEEFTCSQDVSVLYLKKGNFNKYTGLFIATVIKKDRYRWSYGRKWKLERMCNSKLMLPTTDNGDLDLEFMEDYIKSLHHKLLTTNNTKSDLNFKHGN